MKKYKLIYEKDGKFYGSESGIPAATDHAFVITREALENYGLVYSKDGVVYYSNDNLPYNADDVAATAIETPTRKNSRSSKKSTEQPAAPAPVETPAETPVVE